MPTLASGAEAGRQRRGFKWWYFRESQHKKFTVFLSTSAPGFSKVVSAILAFQEPLKRPYTSLSPRVLPAHMGCNRR
jgi:hypothetical protein